MISRDRTRPRLYGILFMLIASIFFASMGACLKYALDEIPVFQAMFFRSIVSSLILALVIFQKGLPYIGENRRHLLLRSLSGFCAMVCGFTALSYIPIADASVLHHTSPFFVAIFSVFFLGEQVTKRLVLLIALAFAGVVMIIRPTGEVMQWAALLGLLSGAFAGLAYVFVRRLHQTDNTWVIAFHFTTLTSLLTLPLMVMNFVLPTTLQWWALIGAGLCGTGGQVFMTVAYRMEAASILAPFNYAAVLISFFYGWLFWDELADLWSLLGMIIVIASGVAIAWFRFPHRKTPVSEVSGP